MQTNTPQPAPAFPLKTHKEKEKMAGALEPQTSVKKCHLPTLSHSLSPLAPAQKSRKKKREETNLSQKKGELPNPQSVFVLFACSLRCFLFRFLCCLPFVACRVTCPVFCSVCLFVVSFLSWFFRYLTLFPARLPDLCVSLCVPSVYFLFLSILLTSVTS